MCCLIVNTKTKGILEQMKTETSWCSERVENLMNILIYELSRNI